MIIKRPNSKTPYNSPMEYIIDTNSNRINIKIGDLEDESRYYNGIFYKKPNEDYFGIDIQPYINKIKYDVDLFQSVEISGYTFQNEVIIKFYDIDENLIDDDNLIYTIESPKYQDWLNGYNYSSLNNLVKDNDGKIKYVTDNCYTQYLNDEDYLVYFKNGVVNDSGYNDKLINYKIEGDGKFEIIRKFLYNENINSEDIFDVFFNNSIIVDGQFVDVKPYIIIGGRFNFIYGESYNNIILLNINEDIQKLTPNNYFNNNIGTGFNNSVKSIYVGNYEGGEYYLRYYIGGNFTSYNGTTVNRIVALKSDGTIDTSFNIGTGFNNSVNSIYVGDYEGGEYYLRYYIGGSFTSYNGTNVNRIVALKSDGTIDTSFNIGTGIGGGNVETIHSVIENNEYNLYLAGSFTSYNGTNVNGLVSLKLDGSVNRDFDMGTGFNNIVKTINSRLINEEKTQIYFGGSFTSYNGTNVNRIVALKSDGTIDTSFNIGTGFNNTVYHIETSIQDKIIVTGNFTEYNGVSSSGLIVLNIDGSVYKTFDINSPNPNNIKIKENYLFSFGIFYILSGYFKTFNGKNTNKRIIFLDRNFNLIDDINTVRLELKKTDPDCYKGDTYQLHWKNRRGGIDWIVMGGKNYVEGNIDRYNYNINKRTFKDGQFSGDLMSDTKPQYLSTSQREYDLNSDIIFGDEYKKLEDLFDSDLVYLYNSVDKSYKNVEVIDTNYKYKNFRNDGIFNLNVKVREKIKNKR